jgi:hypothetical protein
MDEPKLEVGVGDGKPFYRYDHLFKPQAITDRARATARYASRNDTNTW